ncbi:hypothetical protein [Bacillus sp. CDB3]|nr:hypothetical protein [Bacillus sp. CDB3]
MLNLKTKFKKIIPASMALATLLTVAPLSSHAATNIDTSQMEEVVGKYFN